MSYVKAKSNTAFSPMRDPIDRRPLHIGIVLLVGGQSKRMGCNKQLLPWRGKTVLDAVCGALHCGWNDSVELTESCKLPFVAVTGDDHERLEPIVTRYGFEVVQNEHPNRGQGLSIAIGVRHLVENSPIPLDGILCSVGDQPLLTGNVVHQVISAFSDNFHSKTIVVPHYGANYQSGNPVLFGSHWFESLQHIQGDQGGKTIIRGSGKDHVIKLWIRDDIGYDIDTPDDFERLKQRESEAL